MDHKKLASLAQSIMIGTDNCDELGGGAEKIVSNMKIIEEFNLETEAETWVSDDVGTIKLESTEIEKTAASEDSKKTSISASKRSNGSFVVIPRVV